MSPNHSARLERMLRNHPDAVLAEQQAGRSCFYRRDQMLVAADDVPVVEDRVRRWIDRREDHAALGLVTLHLRRQAGVEVPALIDEVAGQDTSRRAATPNHLLRGEPVYSGGPSHAPVVPQGTPPALPDAPEDVRRRTARVAILDTGICEHPWWSSAPWFGSCGPESREILDGDLDYRLDAQAGHGTFVAGQVLSMAPGAELLVERALAGDGICDELELVGTLRRLWHRTHAVGRPVDVVNLSFGGYTFDDRPSPHIERTLDAFGSGTAVVACAGNNASDRPFWPAALETVIAVGALDEKGTERASFSNYGAWVDAGAIGQNVTGAFITFDGPLRHTAGMDPDRFTGYATWSGTSFAAPTVAGAIASIVASAGLSAPAAGRRLLTEGDLPAVAGLGVSVTPEMQW